MGITTTDSGMVQAEMNILKTLKFEMVGSN